MTLRPTSSDLPAHLTRLPDLDAAWTEASAGVRLDAVRRDGRRLRDTLADRGPAIAVRTSELWVMSQRTRKRAIIDVMKSANATFHAPPWWP